MTQKYTATVEVVDHGIDHSQYFTGCGVMFTSYEECVTGIGDDFSEAIEDALETIAIDLANSDKLKAIEAACREDLSLADGAKWPDSDSVNEELTRQGIEDAEECELYYHVSIRYSIGR